MQIMAILLLLLPTGIDRGSFALVSTPVAQMVGASKECTSVDCPCCDCSHNTTLDYNTGYFAARGCKKALYVAKNVAEMAAAKKTATDDGAIFCVTSRDEFPDGVTIYDFRDGALLKRAPKVVEQSLEVDESCSDGSCGPATSIRSSGGFFRRGSSSCSSCQ